MTVDFDVKVARDGNTAEGTYSVTGEAAIPLGTGDVTGEKQTEE